MATVEISNESLDRLVVDCLKQTLSCLRMDIARLQSHQQPLSRVHTQDLADMLSYEPALVKTLQYYTPHAEWENI